MRLRTNLAGFDLPTEAQWEYACRAGKSTVFNDGNSDANVSGDNANTNVWLDALGRHKFNNGFPGGSVSGDNRDYGPTKATAIVGSYLPNTWGLYDMHGNVLEWCLDWFGPLVSATDPPGAGTSTLRMVRGGCWNWEAQYCTSAYRYQYEPTKKDPNLGFRPVCNIAQ